MRNQAAIAILTMSMLCGCTATRTNEAEAIPEYLAPHGWHNPNRHLEHTSFSDYASSIRQEVRLHRIPFDAKTANQEVSMVSPAELRPAEKCSGTAAGIAILVHGLSDTAFSMQDVARILADSCYISRTVLLPGHGTRAGDLLTTRLKHWDDTLTYLIDQASTETNNILLVGFSLGAVLTLHQAMIRNEDIDGIIALSPAYHLSSYRLARWSPWLHRIVPWIDRGIADDAMRYEAMPTRGVAETIKAIQNMRKQIQQHGSIKTPWLLAQSMDDAVVLPQQNQQFWREYAAHPESRLISFYSDTQPEQEPRASNISGKDSSQRVLGLTHLAIHLSPDNAHYGQNGSYRNCGLTAPRDRALVRACQQSESVWYGLWNSEPKPGRAQAMSTFNPAFEEFAVALNAFATKVAEHAD